MMQQGVEMAKNEEMPGKTHAVILSGGGANGAYEIGVMKALFGGHVKLGDDPLEAPTKINPGIFTGTSVGSFSAAFIVSRPGQNVETTLAELEDLWKNRIAGTKTRWNGVFRLRGNIVDFLDLNRMLVSPLTPPANLFHDAAFFAKDSIDRLELFFRSKEEVVHRLMDLVDFSTLLSTEPLHDLVRESVNLENIRNNEECVLSIAATNWEKGETELFANRKAGDPSRYKELNDKIGHLAILASTAIPGIFPPVEIYHTKYVDGGMLMNTPLSPAIQFGADVLHVIYLDPDLKDVPLDRAGGTLDMLNRMTALAFASQVNRDVKEARSINQVQDLHRQIAEAVEAKLNRERIASLGLGPAGDTVQKFIGDALKDIAGIGESHRQRYGKQDLRPLTIHRYHPRSLLEGGLFGLLNFDSWRIGELIDQGFQDAVTHDCVKCGCIFPTVAELCKATDRITERKKQRTRRDTVEIAR
jgi:predicted acylesterase/phospholipase RssA